MKKLLSSFATCRFISSVDSERSVLLTVLLTGTALRPRYLLVYT